MQQPIGSEHKSALVTTAHISADIFVHPNVKNGTRYGSCAQHCEDFESVVADEDVITVDDIWSHGALLKQSVEKMAKWWLWISSPDSPFAQESVTCRTSLDDASRQSITDALSRIVEPFFSTRVN